MLEVLEQAELDIQPEVVWALGELGGIEARKALIEALNREQDEQVREEIRAALDAMCED